MRIKTPVLWLTSVLKLASHAAMGVAMGLVFTLVLSIADPAGIVTLIKHGASPGPTWSMFVGTVVLTFAIGATLTGRLYHDRRSLTGPGTKESGSTWFAVWNSRSGIAFFRHAAISFRPDWKADDRGP